MQRPRESIAVPVKVLDDLEDICVLVGRVCWVSVIQAVAIVVRDEVAALSIVALDIPHQVAVHGRVFDPRKVRR